MLCMKELTDKFKLSVRSTGEVHEALNALVTRFRTTGEVSFRGKLTREAVVNAAILFLDALPAPDKAQALKAGLARLEAILEGADVASLPAPSLPAPSPDAIDYAESIPPQTGRRIPKIRKDSRRGGAAGA